MSNTQGAPTTGLGQNVTFAADPVSGAPTLSPLDEGMARIGGGAQGAQRVQPEQVDPTSFNRTAAMWGKLGEAVTGKLKEMDDKAFMDGALKAAQGASVQQVADEQPWYANLFGASSAELGAKAYKAQSAVQTTLLDLQSRMGDLSMLDAGAAREEFVRAMQSALTGDTQHDAVVKQTFLKSMPTLVDQQTKLHIAHVNREALRTQSEARRGVFALIEGDRTSIGTTRTKEEHSKWAAQVIADTLPQGFQNTAVGVAAFAADVGEAAAQGQFLAVEAALANGRRDLLTPEQRAFVEARIKAGNAKLRNTWMDANAVEVMALEYGLEHATDGLTPKQHFDKLMEFTKAGQDATGMTEPMYDPNRAALLLKGGMEEVRRAEAAQARELERRAKASADKAEKAQAEAEKQEAVAARFAAGDAYGVLAYTTKENLETMGWESFAALSKGPGGYDAAMTMLAKFNTGDQGHVFSRVSKHLQTRVEAAITSMKDGNVTEDGIANFYQPWLAAKKAGLNNLYFGDKLDGQLTRFHNELTSYQGSPAVGMAMAFERGFVRGRDPAMGKAAIEAIDDLDMDELDDLSDDQKKVAVGYLDLSFYPDAAEGIKQSLPSKLKNGELEILGGTVIRNGRNSTPLKSFLRTAKLSGKYAEQWGGAVFASDDKEIDEAYKTATQLQLHGLPSQGGAKKLGGVVPHTDSVVSSVTIRGTVNGEPVLLAQHRGESGATYETIVKVNDLFAAKVYNRERKHQGLYGRSAHLGESKPRGDRALFERARDHLINK